MQPFLAADHVSSTSVEAARSDSLHGGPISTSKLVDQTVIMAPLRSQETLGVSEVPRVSQCDKSSYITCDKFCNQRENIEVSISQFSPKKSLFTDTSYTAGVLTGTTIELPVPRAPRERIVISIYCNAMQSLWHCSIVSPSSRDITSYCPRTTRRC